MDKILTVSVAAYNDQKYIKRLLDSIIRMDTNLLENIEILVNDDGGTDNTRKIVEEYENKFPNIIKFIHKANGGYGSVVNNNLEIACGKYFKQLDGDDCFDTDGLCKLIKVLKNNDVSMVYTPYELINVITNKTRKIDVFGIETEGKYDIKDVELNTPLYMHSVCYKTELLRRNGYKQLERCLYTDVQYAIEPVAFTKTVYIMHDIVYLYFIGMDEQSISKMNLKKHYIDSINVSFELIKFYNDKNIVNGTNKYVRRCISDVCCGTIFNHILLLDVNKKNLEILYKFDNEIKKRNREIFCDMSNYSKKVKMLRKFKYNYFIYLIMHFCCNKKIRR